MQCCKQLSTCNAASVQVECSVASVRVECNVASVQVECAIFEQRLEHVERLGWMSADPAQAQAVEQLGWMTAGTSPPLCAYTKVTSCADSTDPCKCNLFYIICMQMHHLLHHLHADDTSSYIIIIFYII